MENNNKMKILTLSPLYEMQLIQYFAAVSASSVDGESFIGINETSIYTKNRVSQSKIENLIACTFTKTDAANYLGFANSNAFKRAFKRWKKITPARYRQLYRSVK